MRDRGHVPDIGNLESGCLKRAQRGLPSRTGPLHEHTDLPHPMLHCLLGCVLRPDLRSGGELPMLILHSLLALPLPLWFGVMLYQKFHHDDGRSVGTLLILAAYCAPYFIINADPRYRLLADLVVLLHLVTMAAARLQQRAEARNNANSDD